MREARSTCFIGALWLVVSLIGAASPALAQEDATIVGQVKDDSGAVLPGVTVTAISPALQVRQVSVVTDNNGEYRLGQLPIGTYDVTYELAGFGSVRNAEIRLTVGFIAKLDVVLKVGTLEESITVTGQSPLVDVTSTGTNTQLTREVLETIPVARVGMNSLLATAPGARTALDVGGSTALNVPTFRAFGQSGQAWTTIEGIVSSQARPNSAFGNYYDFAVVTEANVRSSGANADMPFRGIQLEQVVKSGGDDFHGSGYLTWTNNSLTSNNLTDELRQTGLQAPAKLHLRSDVTGDFGGRIVRDSLWFYGAFTQNRHKADILDHPQEDGTNGYRLQRGSFTTLKLSYQTTPTLRIVGFSQWGQKLDFNTFGSSLASWGSRSEQNHTTMSSKVEVQKTWRDLVVSGQLGRFGYGGPWHAIADSGQSRMNLTTGFRSGTDWGNWPPGIVANSYDWQPSAKVTLYKPDLFFGDHEFKGGTYMVMYDLGLASYTRTVADPSAGVTFPTTDYQLLYVGAPPNAVASQISIRNSPVDPHTRSNWTGTFVQDNWVIGRRVTLNAGLRWDRDNAFVPEQCREASASFPELFQAECYDRVQFKIHNTLAPRLHMSWDLTGDARTVVKGGWGRFYERRALEPEGVAATRNVDQRWTFRWRDLNGNDDYDRGEVHLDRNGADFVSVTPLTNGVPNVTDERQPKSDEFMLSLERQLTSAMAVRVTGIYSTSTDRKVFDNPLRPYDAHNIPVTRPDPGPDGTVGNADDPGGSVTYWDYSTALRGAAFEQTYARNLDAIEASYASYELAISRRMANRFMFQASYSYTKLDEPVDFLGVGQLASYNPNSFINASSDGNEYTGKVSGAIELPQGVMFSARWEAFSGAYWARTALIAGGVSIPNLVVTVEDRNSRRLPTMQHLDLRVDKKFMLARGHGLSIRMNIYNALNASTVTAINGRSGPQFGRPTSIMPSRILDIGATYSF